MKTLATRHLSIRVLAPLLLIIPVLGVSLLLLMIAGRSAKQAAVLQAYGEMGQVHTTVAERINALLVMPPRMVNLNLGLIEQGRFDPAESDSWRDALITQSNAVPWLSSITWGSAQGEAAWLARYGGDASRRYYAVLLESDAGQMREYEVSPDDEVAPEPSSRFEFEPRGRPWYLAGLEHADRGEGAWSQPYVWVGDNDSEPTMGLSYGKALRDGQGNVLGVMSADLSLNDMSIFLEGLRIGKHGIAFIVDAEHGMIATSNHSPLTDEALKRLAVRNVVDESIGDAVAALRQFESNADGSREGLADVQGEPALVMAAPVGGEAGLDWRVVTIVPVADFTGDAKTAYQRGLIVAMFAVLLAVVLGFAIAGWLANPIIRLSRHTGDIGQGNLDAEIHLDSFAELSELSQAMNSMTVGLRDRMELRRSLDTAKEVQQNLLPDKLPEVQGLDIAGHSDYCDQTGGDYYDYIEIEGLSDRSVAIVVGDVMGHGIAAAMLMSTARGILRSRCTTPGTTGQLLQHLNDLLTEVTGGTRFMTMLLATLDADTRVLRWASAGHDPPLIYDPAADTFIEIEGGGLPLGIVEGEDYEEYTTAPMPVGTVIAIPTDGVFEARNPEGEFFGKDRIRDMLKAHAQSPAAEIARVIDETLTEFQGDSPQEDDITYVVIKVG